MNIKIIVDSSANLRTAADGSIVSVPLTLRTDEREFVDDTTLNIEEILAKPNSELTPEEKELKKKYALQKAMELKAQREAQKNADNSKKETK